MISYKFHFSSRRKNSKFAKNVFDKVKIYLVVPVVPGATLGSIILNQIPLFRER